jgi:hypothetical protein
VAGLATPRASARDHAIGDVEADHLVEVIRKAHG